MALSKNQIERLWVAEGGSPKAAPTAAAIALAESGGKRDAKNLNSNGTVDRGLFQVNSIHGDKSTFDLRANVRAAIAISGNGRNWKPWVTYNTGAFKKYASGGSSGSSGSSRTPGQSLSQSSSRTIPGVDNSAARQAAQSTLGANARAFLATPPGAPGSDILDFALQQRGVQQQIQSLQDTPSRTVQIPGQPGLAGSTVGSGGLDYASRANAIDSRHLPYKWGGGHAGKVNPYKAVPVDCSGAVSSVLGIDPRVAADFKKFGRPGRAPGGQGVTIYAKDTHVLMEINGHFFGTSASNPGGGAGWIKRSDISPDYLKGFTVRHTDA